MADHLYTNHLINEKSPYLQQHAHNPVDWYPWSEEAFESAKAQDKPIFLSIGYATCHWCHVMERESFDDEKIAKLMNDNFINIKVDREELPQVDALYMEVAQAMLGGGVGWPLNVILTPELKPIFVTTYLPAFSRGEQFGLVELIERIKELWHSDQREQLLDQSDEILRVVQEHTPEISEELPGKAHLDAIAEIFYQMADPVNGGLQGAPKFPMGFQISFMLRHLRSRGDSRAIFYVQKTLDHMHRGGIYDHLGGGFSRYSVDDEWLVPHFEKMLYDNAILIRSYCEAWQCTQEEFYRSVCEDICAYILRDMTHPDGGFYTAEDAESEGHEGRFYTWTVKEVEEVLGEKEAALFCAYYDVTPEGNFEGRNVLHIVQRAEEFIAIHHLPTTPQELEKQLEQMRKTLWRARESRPHPLKDDKILTAWNGLMICALAEAGFALNREDYVHAAERAAIFIRDHLCKDGKLLRRWRDGEAKHTACLEDYTFLIAGLLSLFKAGRDSAWLKWAQELTRMCEVNFKSPGGPFYHADGSDPNLLLRKCDLYDGAEPSGNGVHCENLVRLYQLTSDQHYLEQAEDILHAVKTFFDQHPLGACYHCMALQRYVDKHGLTIVIALTDDTSAEKVIKAALGRHFAPTAEIIWRGEKDQQLWELLAATQHQTPQQNQPTLYLCHEGACKPPIVGVKAIVEALSKI